MKATIIGTGNMGRAIASRALVGGHEVRFIGTVPSKAQDLADEMLGEGQVEAGEEVAGQIVVLAVPYTEAPHVVREYAHQLGGRIIVDPTNPVDLSTLDRLDDAWIGPFGSGAQLIAAETPDNARLVKGFNTNFAGPLLAGAVDGQPLDVFLAGDDADAKAVVAQVVSDGGMRAVDAGPLTTARELEETALLHMQIQGSLGAHFASAIKIVVPR